MKKRIALVLAFAILFSSVYSTVAFLQVLNGEGKILMRMKYSGFTRVAGKEIPTYIETYNNGLLEIIKLSRPEEIKKLPPELDDFKFAAGTEVEKVED